MSRFGVNMRKELGTVFHNGGSHEMGLSNGYGVFNLANGSHRVGKAGQTLQSRTIVEYSVLPVKEIYHQGDSYS
uniref:Uncharacterized protein n=1 Tax=Oryza glumipatula TaxID=40148 RepID=A0A0E0BQG8_9ORYZ